MNLSNKKGTQDTLPIVSIFVLCDIILTCENTHNPSTTCAGQLLQKKGDTLVPIKYEEEIEVSERVLIYFYVLGMGLEQMFVRKSFLS